MRRPSALGLIALISVSGLLLSGVARAQAPIPFGIVPGMPNAWHIDPGRALDKEDNPFYPSRATTEDKHITVGMFDPPEVCGGCHTEIYKQWNGSMHSNAWTDPVYRAVLNLASRATQGKVDNLCMGCHTPIGVTTGEANPAGEGMSAIAERGVQCDFCHNVSSARGIGNAPYVLTPHRFGRPLKFGPFDDAVSPYHDTTYSELHTKSGFCGMCHNVTHPFTAVPIERTYDEWKDSIYAAQGIGCQECHMTPGPGYTKNPGRATPFSKEREHIFTHWFVGANVMVPTLFGATQHADMARENLRASATIEFVSPPAKAVPGGIVTMIVRVTNVGAGHKLPTGFPEGREMWVDFKVADASGKEVYRLGAVKDGRTEPGTKSFKVIMADDAGDVIDLELWKATHIVSDTRLPPKGSTDLEYRFQIPTGTAGPLSVNAELNYWSFPQYLVKVLLGDQAPTSPITKMTSVESALAVGSAAQP
jgi:cytochrome c554/c'-like protein